MIFEELSRGRVFRFTESAAAMALGPIAFSVWVKVADDKARQIADDILYGGIRPNTLVRDISMDPDVCQPCFGRGYAIGYDPANRPQIKRCPACKMFISDYYAARFAYRDGIKCIKRPPFTVIDRSSLDLFVPPPLHRVRPLRAIIMDDSAIPAPNPTRARPPTPTKRSSKPAKPEKRHNGRRIRYINLGGVDL